MGTHKQPTDRSRSRVWTPWGPLPVEKRAEKKRTARGLADKILRIGKPSEPKLVSR